MDTNATAGAEYLRARLRSIKDKASHQQTAQVQMNNSREIITTMDCETGAQPRSDSKELHHSLPGSSAWRGSERHNEDKTSRRASSSGVTPRTMGAKEFEERYDKLTKQNFDLKLEVLHHREKTTKLEKALQDAKRVEDDQHELMEINDELLRELEKSNQAVDEAVVMICDLEEKVRLLQDDLDELRPSQQGRRIDHNAEIEEVHTRTASTADSTSTVQIKTPSSLGHKRGKSQSTVSFVDNPTPTNHTLRSMYFRDNKMIRPLPSHATLRSMYKDHSEEVQDEPLSPNLSILSKGDLGSLYDSDESISPSESLLEREGYQEPQMQNREAAANGMMRLGNHRNRDLKLPTAFAGSTPIATAVSEPARVIESLNSMSDEVMEAKPSLRRAKPLFRMKMPELSGNLSSFRPLVHDEHSSAMIPFKVGPSDNHSAFTTGSFDNKRNNGNKAPASDSGSQPRGTAQLRDIQPISVTQTSISVLPAEATVELKLESAAAKSLLPRHSHRISRDISPPTGRSILQQDAMNNHNDFQQRVRLDSSLGDATQADVRSAYEVKTANSEWQRPILNERGNMERSQHDSSRQNAELERSSIDAQSRHSTQLHRSSFSPLRPSQMSRGRSDSNLLSMASDSEQSAFPGIPPDTAVQRRPSLRQQVTNLIRRDSTSSRKLETNQVLVPFPKSNSSVKRFSFGYKANRAQQSSSQDQNTYAQQPLQSHIRDKSLPQIPFTTSTQEANIEADTSGDIQNRHSVVQSMRSSLSGSTAFDVSDRSSARSSTYIQQPYRFQRRKKEEIAPQDTAKETEPPPKPRLMIHRIETHLESTNEGGQRLPEKVAFPRRNKDGDSRQGFCSHAI